MKMIQLTHSRSPGRTVDPGAICGECGAQKPGQNYLAFCKAEVLRINETVNRVAAIREVGEGEIAVFVNKPDGHTCGSGTQSQKRTRQDQRNGEGALG